MTAQAEVVETAIYPKMYHHADGRDGHTKTVKDEAEDAKALSEGCWFDRPQEPPPPPPPPMTPEEQIAYITSELEGMGDQVDAQAQVVSQLENRANSYTDVFLEVNQKIDDIRTGCVMINQDFNERVKKLEQSRAGASGVTQNFQDRLAAVEEALKNTATVFEMISNRLETLEGKKGK